MDNNDNMDLIYFYPNLNDAPAMVGKSILKHLMTHQDKNPFESIRLLNANGTHSADIYFPQVSLIKFSDLINSQNDYIVHIPISPNVFPNKKFLLTMWCIIKKKPLLIHYHGDIRKHFITKLIHEKKIDILSVPSVLFMPYILKAATKIITHSYILDETLKSKYGVKNSVVIPNGLDDYWFEPLQKSTYSDLTNKNNFNVFYHGRLSSEKGLDLLINAVGIYAKKNQNTVLHIAGDGPHKKYLQKLCYDLKISKNVVFMGSINKEAIKYYLKNVDVAIYPSRFDNFPLAMIEALACANCPVFFSKNAGLYDFVVKDGYKLNFFKPSIENIIEILDSYLNYDNVINPQISFAKKYTWDIVFDKYLSLYADIYNEFV